VSHRPTRSAPPPAQSGQNVLNLVLPLPEDDTEHLKLLKARSKEIELFHAAYSGDVGLLFRAKQV